MAKNTKATNANVSNAPSYSIDDAVRDAMQGQKLHGKAESGMLVALFNDEQWTLQAVQAYFTSPLSQTVTRADGSKGRDKNITTRAMHANAFLSRVDVFKTALERVNAVKSTLANENKRKPKNALRINELECQRDDMMRPINAAQQMFNRAVTGLYQLRTGGYITVQHGSHNEIVFTRAVKDKEGKVTNDSGTHTVAAIRLAGQEALKTAKFVKSRAPRAGKSLDTAKISIDNSKAVINAIGRVLESDTFKPPLDSDSETVTTKNDLAELALRCVSILKADDMKDAELRGTVSQIALPVLTYLKAKNIDDVRKIVKASANGG